MIKNKIFKLSKKRYLFINEMEKSWDDQNINYSIDNNDVIDSLGNEIYDLIKKHVKKLSFEFIIEELTKLGQAPNLLYDDNGHFAIVSEGFQNVPENDVDDIEMFFYVEKENWKDSIKEALEFYLMDDE